MLDKSTKNRVLISIEIDTFTKNSFKIYKKENGNYL